MLPALSLNLNPVFVPNHLLRIFVFKLLNCESFKHKNGNQYGIYILNKNQFSIVLFACILLTLLHLNVCKLPKITQFDRRKIVFFLQQADSLKTINQKLGISCHGYGYFEKTWKRADKHL